MDQEDNNQPAAGWVFKPGGAPAAAVSPGVNDDPLVSRPHAADVSWSASEYVASPKNTSWFAMLAAASIALAVIVYFITSDVVSTGVIIVLAIIVGVFAARQPRVLEYQLNNQGIHMGQRFYSYNSFKSFSTVSEGAFNHVSLLPLKRFMPPLAIHYPPEEEDKIIDMLADYLPYEEHKRDPIENFSRRVRF